MAAVRVRRLAVTPYLAWTVPSPASASIEFRLPVPTGVAYSFTLLRRLWSDGSRLFQLRGQHYDAAAGVWRLLVDDRIVDGFLPARLRRAAVPARPLARGRNCGHRRGARIRRLARFTRPSRTAADLCPADCIILRSDRQTRKDPIERAKHSPFCRKGKNETRFDVSESGARH